MAGGVSPAPTDATATEAQIKHGLQKGESVRIVGAGKFPNHSPHFNGNFRVTDVPNDQTFKYKISGDPGTDHQDPAFAPGYWGRIWRSDWVVAENNVIELILRPLWPNNDFGRALGFAFYVGGYPPEYVLRQALIRDNLIRHVNNGSDPSNFPRAIEMSGVNAVENCLIQRNVVRLDRQFPIEYRGSGLISFDNVSEDGLLVVALNTLPPPPTAPETVSAIQAATDEVMAAAFLR